MRPGRMDRKVEFGLPDLEVCQLSVCVCVCMLLVGGGEWVCTMQGQCFQHVAC